MAIRDHPLIEEALSAVQLSPRAPEADANGVKLPLKPARDETGQVTQDALWLHYSNNTTVSFQRLLKEIEKDLGKSRHPKPDEFSLFVLAFARLMQRGLARAALNTVLESVCDSDVSLFFIIPESVIPDFYQFTIPPFRVGRLRTDTLRNRSNKAGSDFYERYRGLFGDAWAVEREPKATRVLDLVSLRSLIFDVPLLGRERERWEYNAWDALTNGYFSVQNQVLFDEFWAELVTVQDPLLTLGAAFFDPQTVRSPIFNNQQVAVFLNIGAVKKTGYVAPASIGVFNVDLANIHVRVPRLLTELKEQYSFERFDASPLHTSISLFASFVARARRHQLHGLSDEALLHFIIALELIFGVREAIQKSVSERVALITFHEAGRSFDEQRNWINKIYDLRSRYVHEGTKLTPDAPLEEIYVLCQQVFRCLLRLQAAHSSQRGKEILAHWLALLDFLCKGIIAGKRIDSVQFQEAFIT
jgi:hypothetical protein